MFDSSTINRSLPTTRNVVAQAMNCIGSNNERRKRKDCDEFSDSICYLFIYERMSLFQFNMLHGCVLIVSTQCFGLFVPKRIDRAFHGQLFFWSCTRSRLSVFDSKETVRVKMTASFSLANWRGTDNEWNGRGYEYSGICNRATGSSLLWHQLLTKRKAHVLPFALHQFHFSN